MKILVTGASGFLGSAVSKALRDAGSSISLLSSSSSDLWRLDRAAMTNLVVRYESESDLKAKIELIAPDVVIHTACSYESPDGSELKIHKANFLFGANILDSLVKIKKPIFFLNLGTALPSEVNFYALSKNQFTAWGRALEKKNYGNFKFINIALQQMYGPLDDQKKFPSSVVSACSHNENEFNLSLGYQKRDFVFVEDVVSAILLIVRERAKINSLVDVQVGSGRAHSIREFVEIVQRLTKSTTKINYGVYPYRENEPMFCRADIRLLRSLGWKPNFDLESGLKKMLMSEHLK